MWDEDLPCANQTTRALKLNKSKEKRTTSSLLEAYKSCFHKKLRSNLINGFYESNHGFIL